MRDKVEKEVERTVKKLGLAKQSELNALSKEIAALRREVSGRPVKASGKVAAKKAPAKKSAKKAPAKKSAKKSTTKRTSKAGK